jgi:hypothetical protein
MKDSGFRFGLQHGISPSLILRRAAGLDSVFGVGAAEMLEQSIAIGLTAQNVTHLFVL